MERRQSEDREEKRADGRGTRIASSLALIAETHVPPSSIRG